MKGSRDVSNGFKDVQEVLTGLGNIFWRIEVIFKKISRMFKVSRLYNRRKSIRGFLSGSRGLKGKSYR